MLRAANVVMAVVTAIWLGYQFWRLAWAAPPIWMSMQSRRGPDMRLPCCWIIIGEQEHSLTGSPWQPQGQGSIATSNTRLPGKLTVAMRG